MLRNKDYFSSLPAELQLSIFSHIEKPLHLIKLSAVSRLFYQLSYEKQFWKRLLKPDYHNTVNSKGDILHPRIVFTRFIYALRLEYLSLHPAVDRVYPALLQLLNTYKTKAVSYLIQTAKQSSLNAQILFSYQELYAVLLQDVSFETAHQLIEICILYPESAMLLLSNTALCSFIKEQHLLTIDLLKHFAIGHAEVARLILIHEKFYKHFLANSYGIQYLKVISKTSVQAALTILNTPSLYEPILLEKDAHYWLYDMARRYPDAGEKILSLCCFYNVLLQAPEEIPSFLNAIGIAHPRNAIIILNHSVFYKNLLQKDVGRKIVYNFAKQYPEAAKFVFQSEWLCKCLLSNTKDAMRYLMSIAKAHEEAVIMMLEQEKLYRTLCPTEQYDNNLYKIAKHYRLKITLSEEEETHDLRLTLLHAFKQRSR